MNSPEARSPTGEILSQAPATETPTTTPATETPQSTTTPATEPAAEPPKEGTSLLNEEEPKVEAKAPDAYTEFKVPEGYTIDKATAEAAAPIFKELNLSQDQAQKLVDFYTSKQQEAIDAPHKAYQELAKTWQDEVKAKYGNQLPEVKATIGRAIATLPVETQAKFRAAMDLTGAGNNLAFVETFYALAKRATEGRPVVGSGPAAVGDPNKPPPSPAKALFPNLPSATSQ
jgi:hypothetical protein